MKVESPDIPQTTEAGAVRLNLRDEEEFGAAFETILANARCAASNTCMHGVLLQPVAPPETEIMVGVRIDPQFGLLSWSTWVVS